MREEEEMQAACFGRRKGLPLKTSMSDEECAEQLLSARETLRCNPALEDAKCELHKAVVHRDNHPDYYSLSSASCRTDIAVISAPVCCVFPFCCCCC